MVQIVVKMLSYSENELTDVLENCYYDQVSSTGLTDSTHQCMCQLQ
jgi:hypothetical protein